MVAVMVTIGSVLCCGGGVVCCAVRLLRVLLVIGEDNQGKKKARVEADGGEEKKKATNLLAKGRFCNVKLVFYLINVLLSPIKPGGGVVVNVGRVFLLKKKKKSSVQVLLGVIVLNYCGVVITNIQSM